MDLIFKVCVTWLCLRSLAIYTQAKSYGHLMVFLGATFTLLTFLLLHHSFIGWVILIAGGALFWAGMATLATFEREEERERFRSSSWREILLGRVPERLQKQRITETRQVAEGLIISLVFALLFYQSGDRPLSLFLVVIGIVYAFYLLGGRKRTP
jgi:cytochrome c biogenesis protein CcdA